MPESTLNTPSRTTSAPTRWTLAALVVAAGIAAGALVGIGIAAVAGWPSIPAAAGLATLVWIAAAALGLAFMVLLTRIQPDNLGFGILASSMVRILSALGFGLVAFFAVGPAGPAFWVIFLLAGLGALIAETAWAMKTLSPASPSLAPEPAE